MTISKLVFEHFASVSAKQWKQKIQYELQGLDYQKTLIKNTPDGIDKLPFYSEEDIDKRLPEAVNIESKSCIEIEVKSADLANKEALIAIDLGFEAINFICYSPEVDLTLLLNSLNIDIYLNPHFLNLDFNTRAKKFNSNIIVLNDPLSKVTRTGSWYRNYNYDFSQLKKIIDTNSNCLSINQSLFHNAGATPAQQLAYSIAQLQQYDNEISLKNCNTINYCVAVGTDFFIEIAKLNALRILTDSYSDFAKIKLNCKIFQSKSSRNLVLFNQDVNQEISLIEQKIGRYGGVDLISTISEKDMYFNEDLENITNHHKLFLQHHKNNDTIPIYDAIYIEKLTQQLISKAIRIVETIEKGGGFTKQLNLGTIQQKVKDQARLEQNTFNKIAEIDIPKLKKTVAKSPFLKSDYKTKLWQPIKNKRLSASLEKPIWDKLYKNG